MSDGQLRELTQAQPASAAPPFNGAATHRGVSTELDRAIERSREYLLGLQYPEGYWWGELEANCSIHAEFVLLTHFLGIPDPKRWGKIVSYLKSKQLPDGGWPIWYGAPGDLSITTEAYFAMKLAGVDPNDPAMTKARRFILAQGGLPNVRIFTKMWLAMFGQWDWRDTPVLPAELVLLPSWFPFNIYEFASWARGTIVACTILLTLKPACEVPEWAQLDELFPSGRDRTSSSYGKKGDLLSWNGLFRGVDKSLRLLEVSPWNPIRRTALRKAEQWIIDRQEEDGTWGGIQPPWVYSLMALHTLGYSIDHPVMKAGIQGFDAFMRETDETLHTEPCVSPGWDTCLAMLALQDSGLPPSHPALVNGAEWLIKQQILDRGGDWQVKNPNTLPGGWPFEFKNDNYPDIDDAAIILIALHKMQWNDDPRMRRAIQRGVDWTLSMQSKNGGWGSFDVDNAKEWVTHIPFCDFGEVLDPPTEDVSGHMVEMLGRLGLRGTSQAIERGVAYLKETQLPDGSWWGRWGVNYLYGLGAVVPALKWAGEDMSQPYIRKSVSWLEKRQQPDGGWGEGCESYKDPSRGGQGPSTPSQTSWALLALIASGDAAGHAARRGVEYLLMKQQGHGSWDEPEFTGTGFPNDFMINYHMYRDYWPLMALGQYRQAAEGDSGGR